MAVWKIRLITENESDEEVNKSFSKLPETAEENDKYPIIDNEKLMVGDFELAWSGEWFKIAIFA